MVSTPLIVDSRESIFDNKYLLEFVFKIGLIATFLLINQRSHLSSNNWRVCKYLRVDEELITRTPNLEIVGDRAAKVKFTSSGAVFTPSGSEKSAILTSSSNRAASQFTATNSSIKWNSQRLVSTSAQRSALLSTEMKQPPTDGMRAKHMPSASPSGPAVAKKSMPDDAMSGPAMAKKSMPDDAMSGPAVAKKSMPDDAMSGPAVAKISMPNDAKSGPALANKSMLNDAGERSVPRGMVPTSYHCWISLCAVSEDL